MLTINSFTIRPKTATEIQAQIEGIDPNVAETQDYANTKRQYDALPSTEKAKILHRRKSNTPFIDSFNQNYRAEVEPLSELVHDSMFFFNNFFKYFSEAVRKLLPKGDLKNTIESKLLFNAHIGFDNITQKAIKEKKLPFEFLARGGSGDIFKYTGNDKDPYVVKIPGFGSQGSLKDFQREIDLMIQSQHIKGVCKLLGYSLKDLVIVSKFIEGNTSDNLSLNDLKSITREHLNNLVQTVLELQKVGFSFDPNPKNIIFYPKDGFTVIDLGLDRPHSSNMSLMFLLINLSSCCNTDRMNNEESIERLRITTDLLEIILQLNPDFFHDLKQDYDSMLKRYRGNWPDELTTYPLLDDFPLIRSENFKSNPLLKEKLDQLNTLTGGRFY